MSVTPILQYKAPKKVSKIEKKEIRDNESEAMAVNKQDICKLNWPDNLWTDIATIELESTLRPSLLTQQDGLYLWQRHILLSSCSAFQGERAQTVMLVGRMQWNFV